MMSAQDARMMIANGNSLNAFGFHVDLDRFDCACFRHDNFKISDFGVLMSKSFEPEPSESVRTEAIFAIFAIFAEMTAPEAKATDRN